MELETCIGRVLVLVVLGTGSLLGIGPLRRWCLLHPRLVLSALLAFDAALLLYATTPFVVSGYDEAQFVTDAHRVRGADLTVAWIRTPLPVLAIACSPHPALPGILAKQLATLAVYALVRRPLGVGYALFAALYVSAAEEMVANCCEAVSEPYGAAGLAWFAFAVARGGPVALFASATAGAMSRWQMLWLLPAAALVGWRRHGWRSMVVGSAAAAACFAIGLWLTDVDPWRAFVSERTREHAVVERIAFYLSPKVGLDVGPLGMLLALLGGAVLMRERPRSGLGACAVVYLIYFAGVVSVGVIVPRFLGPAVPLLVVVAVRGVASLVQRRPLLARPWPAAILGALFVVASAIPVHAPRMRERKLTSPQAPVALERTAVLSALGGAPLYSDVDAQKIAAILARRCVAVGADHAETPDGQVERARIPSGSLYLTYDVAGRTPLWSSGRLALVRW